ncbi:MAG: hypothetical protein R3253_01215 [Longimicrobiales bacterium]|nr:hypothetical protein [Longimicrobiales bacterium]
MRLAEAFESLDPASHDPNYWFRFHGRVMAGAGSELARRRMMANLTVVDVLASWSRTLVPTAMLAAAVAALLLFRTGAGPGVETTRGAEMVAELPGEPMLLTLGSEAPVVFASFAADNF